MNKIIKKITFVLIAFILIVTFFSINKAYAATEEEKAQLFAMLDQYNANGYLGDLQELKVVVDTMYNDINSATKVDDSLKNKLHADIAELSNISGINPLISSTLKVEFDSQVNTLTDENLSELKDEISVIKEWVDSHQVPSDNDNNNDDNNSNNNTGNNNNNSNNNTGNNDNKPIDNTQANISIPQTGEISIIILLGIVTITIVAIYTIRKYKEYNKIV